MSNPRTPLLRPLLVAWMALSVSGCFGESASSQATASASAAASSEVTASASAAASSEVTASASAAADASEATGLDPLLDLETLPAEASPTWPAPPARADGAPVTLRAARTGEDVVIWAYGAPEGVAGLAYDLRLADGNGVVRYVDAGGVPVQGALPGAWYRLTTVRGEAAHAKAQAQITRVQGGSPSKDLWVPALEHRRDWRHALPDAPTKVDAASKVGLSLIGFERLDTIVSKETVLVAAVYNLGTTPITRLELEVVLRDAKGALAPLAAPWVPMGGDVSIPSVPPRGRSVLRIDVSGDVDRALGATDFDLKVGKVER